MKLNFIATYRYYLGRVRVLPGDHEKIHSKVLYSHKQTLCNQLLQNLVVCAFEYKDGWRHPIHNYSGGAPVWHLF